MTDPLDPDDPGRARSARGLLATFNSAGVLDGADVHAASRIGSLADERSEPALLALALAVRGLRHGSVCIDLTGIGGTVLGEADELLDVSELPWPEPASWLAACRAGHLVTEGERGGGDRPLRLVDGLLYLERYWQDEETVRRSLLRRATGAPPQIDLAALQAGLRRLFGAPQADAQRLAAAVGVLRRVSVLAGGPGTGKTTTVAGLLQLLFEQPGPPPRIALAAPTGKAAARLEEAVTGSLPAHLRSQVPAARTLHRLLGHRPGGRDRTQRLPYDVVVVDETSMVSLTMMARLLEAVRPAARLVLVGDPDQLASVEAGAVLGDLVKAEGPAEPELDARLAALDLPTGIRHGVVTLDHVWRFGGAIAGFARAVQAGDPDAAVELLTAGHDDLQLLPPGSTDPVRGDVVAAGRKLAGAARSGDIDAALDALDAHRVLCAHRLGPYGVARWTADIERWLRDAALGPGSETWYPGRPVLVTVNDYDTGLFNGDIGVVVVLPEGPRIAFPRRPDPVPPNRLTEVSTVHAMTVHRGQGSQFRRVTVVLPQPESPLLTRELLYTAVTRAKERVRVIGTVEAVRAAVERPVSRASGLRRRLGNGGDV